MHTAIAKLLLRPIVRVSLPSTIKPSPLLRLFHTNIYGNGASQTWLKSLKLRLHRSFPNPCRNLIFPKSHRLPARIFRISGGRFVVNTLLGLSVVIVSWPRIAHCTNGYSYFTDDRSYSMSGYPESDDSEDHRTLRKLLLPFYFLLTVLMNWGQPVAIAAKLILILYGSKPSPFSVYFVIEQLLKQSMRRRPIIYRYTLNQQSCYAKKVEIEDYVFFCFARAELDDQNLTLVGVLGSWWVLPRAS